MPDVDAAPIGRSLPASAVIAGVQTSRGLVFDVNETLFSLERLQPLFESLGLAEHRGLWFTTTLKIGFALNSVGRYRTFPDVARAALTSLAPKRVCESDLEELLAAFAELEPHPDVEPALSRLRQARIPVVTLSVGNSTNVERLFQRAGLQGLVSQHLSCETVQRWKPAPEPYLHACDVLDVAPHDTWMVAAHSWDIGGAAAVGMRTAWIPRLEGVFDSNFGEPDVVGEDLVDLVDRLLT